MVSPLSFAMVIFHFLYHTLYIISKLMGSQADCLRGARDCWRDLCVWSTSWIWLGSCSPLNYSSDLNSAQRRSHTAVESLLNKTVYPGPVIVYWRRQGSKVLSLIYRHCMLSLLQLAMPCNLNNSLNELCNFLVQPLSCHYYFGLISHNPFTWLVKLLGWFCFQVYFKFPEISSGSAAMCGVGG